jgi:hypothetical protein
MTFFTGHRPDPPEVVARRPKLHLHPRIGAIRATPIPLKTNNRAKLDSSVGGPGILDQGQTSSCEGHAHASAITLYFACLGKPIPLVSPVGLYQGALLLQRQPNTDGTLPPLSDDGTEPSLIIQAMSEFGASSADTYGNYPADPSTITSEPTLAQLEAEQNFVLNGAYFMASTGDDKVRDLMACLAAGEFVTDAIPASGPEFQGYSGGVLGALSGPIDHANLIVDYEWDGSNLSSVIVYCANSWGMQWGAALAPGISGGMYQANRAYVDQAADFCVMNLTATGSEA